MIAIGCDHAGYILKEAVTQKCQELGWEVQDFGCMGEPVNYALIAKEVAQAVASGRCERGILICGTGIGMSIAANKVPGIRAAVCTDTYCARMTREHNNANILAMGARVIGMGVASDIVEAFLKSEYAGGRHQERIDTIAAIEEQNFKNG